MADALAQVKREFGADAVILNTRSAVRGKVLGLKERPFVEITAARDLSSLPPALARGTVQLRSSRGELAKANGDAPPRTLEMPHQQRMSAVDPLTAQVGELRSLVDELVRESRRSRSPSIPADLLEYHQRLVSNDVAGELAEELMEKLQASLDTAALRDEKTVKSKLADAIAAMLPSTPTNSTKKAGKPHVVALVGPTGVGKTTTVAKLAANLCLREQARVGLITLDTYRIAAVEQLKTYANIIDVPLEVVATPDELRTALATMTDRDVVFLDTAGRSQRDSARINDLLAFFEIVRPHEIHLVLSATAGQRVLEQAIERFTPLGFDRVIFTKLDEAIGFGVILNCLQKVRARLSYVTTGQDVPSDIRVGEPKFLANLVLEGADGIGRG